MIGYVRVSTSKQAEQGLSLEAQQAKLQAYADLFDVEIVRFEVDTASASSLERPALKRALKALDTFEATAILVVKLDRLTRSVRDLCMLVDTYFKDGTHSLMSVGEQIDTRTAAGRLIINILTIVSQWERETIGERTSAVMSHMKATGMFTGGRAPYGTREENGQLVPVPAEQAILELARAMKADGKSLRSIAAGLGNNPRTGKPFQATQIVRMM